MAEQESVYLWSTTALTNATADPAINWGEGQLPSTVNNSARAQMASVARFVKDIDGSLTTAGSANAYTLTINGRQTPLATGHILTFKASFAITGAATLAVTNADAVALGTKAIRGQGDVALVTGQMISGGVYMVRYDTAANSAAGAWLLLNPSDAREVLSADRTYFVRTDGSNSNTGLANTAGAAKLTLQGAVDAAALVDANGHNITIKVADGTYTAVCVLTQVPIGCAQYTFTGNVTTPASCILSVTNDDCIRIDGVPMPIRIAGFKLITTTGGNCISLKNHSAVYITDLMNFGACASNHMQVDNSNLIHFANYTISGNFADHHHIIGWGTVGADGITVTLSGTPVWTGYYSANGGGIATYTSATFSGSGTGQKYFVHLNGSIKTAGVVLPGTVAGNSDGGNYEDNIFGGAWTAFTPTPTPATGSFTATSSGAYKVMGKWVTFRLTITISNAGTGAGAITVALPTGTSNGVSVAIAADLNVTGHMGRGLINNGSTTMTLVEYDGSTTMIHTSSVIGISGQYEIS